MDAIISPVFIYLLGLIDRLDDIFALIFFIVIIWVILVGIFSEDFCETYEESKILTYKTIKRAGLILTIIITLAFFIPDRNTLIAMYATKYITVNNIKSGKEIVIDTIKEVVDAINKEEK